MSFFLVLKAEFVKLMHKRISLLLLLLFVPTILFGVGMSLGFSFFVSDGGGGGVEAVGSSLSGIGFAVNMMEQSKYIIFLVIIILAASSLSGELENGQIKSEIIRVCSRIKILTAKFVSLLIVVYGAILFSLLWSLLIYAMFVSRTEYASGLLFDELVLAHIGYIFFMILGVSTAISVTFLFGVKLKMFPCFAISYIVWFASLYTDFMGNIKLLIPYNMPNHFLVNSDKVEDIFMYILLYIGYCMMFQIVSCIILKKIDIKS